MEIARSLTLEISSEKAFDNFINHLNKWWPREYTWSQDKLVKISIDPQENGLCTEIGPYRFRCDWGRVINIKENEVLELYWQISPQRIPVPDADRASIVKVDFKQKAAKSCEIQLRHFRFANHGEGAEDYFKAMNSGQGWDYILKCFTEYCKE